MRLHGMRKPSNNMWGLCIRAPINPNDMAKKRFNNYLKYATFKKELEAGNILPDSVPTSRRYGLSIPMGNIMAMAAYPA